MKEYDAIAVGSGSAYTLLDTILERDPRARVALIDKDAPGGICLTRGCIPSKMLLYPADVVGLVERAAEFGVHLRLDRVDFGEVMRRMRHRIDPEIEQIRQEFSHTDRLDYFPAPARFVRPAVLEVAGEEITAKRIFLCTGSQPKVPRIPGLEGSGFLTSDTVLGLTELPPRLAILGGGFVATEYAHFFSAMGARVTLIGRNPRLLPTEEPEVSEFVADAFRRRLDLRTGCELRRVEGGPGGPLSLEVGPVPGGASRPIEVDRLLVATGRAPTSEILDPAAGGVDTTPEGWIRVDPYLATSARGVWALGDATGVFPFKHKANYDAHVVKLNALDGRGVAVDYHAVPHAVFTDPEVAAVGLGERAALAEVGPERLLVGRCRYEETAKGQAMGTSGFAKVLVEKDSLRILGAHVVGPHASLLVQEVVTLLNTPGRSARPIIDGMHIHPALSEVIDWAFVRLRPWTATPAPTPPAG
jgi:mycothione reductase